ncbi:MAG: M28 family metallopeptidase [Oligoflexales bacterium]
MRTILGAGLSLLVLLVSCGDAEAKTFFVSLVQKGQVRELYKSVPTMHHEIVVTDAAVTPNLESVTVDVPDDQGLYLVETLENDVGEVKGEVGRIENIVIAVRPAEKVTHSHDEGNITRFVQRVEPLKYRKAIPSTTGSVRPLPIRRTFTFTSPVAINIEPSALQKSLEELSGEEPFVIDNVSYEIEERGSSNGRKLARSYLKAEYEKIGFTTSEQSYGISGANFIAEKKGSDPSKVIIIASHLDSVRNAGADDDGAGTISALAIATALKDANLKYTLRVLAFDQEELGLVGSKNYVRNLVNKGEKGTILGVVDMEMTGYDSDNDGAFHVIDCNENTSASLSQIMVKAIQSNSIDLERVPACTDRSDHAPFWEEGMPAIVISQNFFGGDGNSCYHKSCDRTDRINWTYMANLTKAVGHTVANLVEAQP